MGSGCADGETSSSVDDEGYEGLAGRGRGGRGNGRGEKGWPQSVSRWCWGDRASVDFSIGILEDKSSLRHDAIQRSTLAVGQESFFLSLHGQGTVIGALGVGNVRTESRSDHDGSAACRNSVILHTATVPYHHRLSKQTIALFYQRERNMSVHPTVT